MSDWEQTTWGAIADLRYGKALRDYRELSDGVVVFGTNGPVGYTRTAQVEGPGVIIGRKGAYRGVHYSASDFWVIDTAFYLAPKVPLDSRWAYYSLQLADINGLDSGSAIPSTTRESFGSLPALIPSLSEQQAIAGVLGALDDKIAANETVAASADDLMRVEYLAISRGNTVSIREVADSPRTGVHPSSVEATSPYIGLEHLPRRRMWLSRRGNAGDVISAKSRFAKHDVLFGKLRPYFHKVSLAPFDGVCSTDVLVVRAKDPVMSAVLLAAVSSDAVVQAVVAASEGTRMPRTSWKDLAALEVSWPDTHSANALASRLDSISAAATSALKENDILAATRDALLPQLMSGKLRARDAEAAASAAGA